MKGIAKHPDGLVLYYLSDVDEWKNFKLVSLKQRRKQNWRIGWNGQRLSQGRDVKWLAQRWPEIHEWLLNILPEVA